MQVLTMNRNIIIAYLLMAVTAFAAGWRVDCERKRADRLQDQFTDMQRGYAKEAEEFYALVFGDCKREAERLAKDRIALQQQWIKLMLHP